MPETRTAYDPEPGPEHLDRVERIVMTYETLMHRVASAHAPEFLAVGVTMSQAKVLYLVQAEPGLRMSELSARLCVSLSTISGVVDRLVDQGFLSRTDDPADRRQVVLGITHAGADQVELFRELSSGQVRDLLAQLDEADLAVVERALDVLAAAALRPASASSASPPSASKGEPA
ncbi:MAG TPA: MarR family transcriptional regulator [Patescibacteria group bacterium]|nr:MarR family transcriptional regulator [Patescibacteria group bacterium]